MNVKKQTKKSMVFLLVIILSFTAITSLFLPDTKGNFTYNINTFSSYAELQSFLSEVSNQSSAPYYSLSMDNAKTGSTRQNIAMESSTSSDTSLGESSDFSKTNIQVTGVDEPDLVKTDGTYLYVTSKSNVYIIKAYPSDDATLLSTIQFNETTSIEGIFINQNTLIVFSNTYEQSTVYKEKMIYEPYYIPHFPKATIQIYNITSRTQPHLEKTLKIDGSYFDARMINDMVYVVSIEYASELYPLINGNQTLRIPEICIDNKTTPINPNTIYYVDVPDKVDTMTHVICFDVNKHTITQKSFLLGYSQTMYVSKNAIYLASNHYPTTSGFFEITSASEASTIIHKISIDEQIKYTAQGEIPGTILNQFSMDEHNGFFRIATTIGTVWNQNTQSTNNIFILDDELSTVSSIRDIAPGERIYSTRFMEEKAYLVTFKKIDPFFTIDLSDPYHPKILGKLKIPGYSDYLHPFDENHIIGIGKETVEALTDEKTNRNLDFAWYQGVKIAIFNVTDVTKPTELYKEIIGDRGTTSPVLYNHKALLFDREKELFVLPVSLYEIPDEIKQQYDNYTGGTYGEFTFQGVYVYQINLNDGFKLKGTITHLDDSSLVKTGFYPEYQSSITRSLYIENTLYTISESTIGVHDLENLTEITMISLP